MPRFSVSQMPVGPAFPGADPLAVRAHDATTVANVHLKRELYSANRPGFVGNFLKHHKHFALFQLRMINGDISQSICY